MCQCVSNCFIYTDLQEFTNKNSINRIWRESINEYKLFCTENILKKINFEVSNLVKLDETMESMDTLCHIIQKNHCGLSQNFIFHEFTEFH